MTPEVNTTEKKPFGYPEPYPRRCVSCAQRAVYLETGRYETEERYEGRTYPLVFENFTSPVCRACGEPIYTGEVEREIDRRFRVFLRILSPEQIRDGIAGLGITPLELSERLGISEEKMSRYLRGWEMQPRVVDDSMRVCFALPSVSPASTASANLDVPSDRATI